jgi:hypothetical protein
VSRNAPWISHLLFADDCLIFTQATKWGADRVAAILDDYNRGLGQLVNKHKSAIFSVQIVGNNARKKYIRACKSQLKLLVNDIWACLPRLEEEQLMLLIMFQPGLEVLLGDGLRRI